eukprot:GHVL01022017.1.p1 GENE.GHVL01022017.1~~GHVL01022017.1.p1  ORF type:complete len:566 (+),score=116.02 GHVL01022017.1:86-1783(+)
MCWFFVVYIAICLVFLVCGEIQTIESELSCPEKKTLKCPIQSMRDGTTRNPLPRPQQLFCSSFTQCSCCQPSDSHNGQDDSEALALHWENVLKPFYDPTGNYPECSHGFMAIQCSIMCSPRQSEFSELRLVTPPHNHLVVKICKDDCANLFKSCMLSTPAGHGVPLSEMYGWRDGDDVLDGKIWKNNFLNSSRAFCQSQLGFLKINGLDVVLEIPQSSDDANSVGCLSIPFLNIKLPKKDINSEVQEMAAELGKNISLQESEKLINDMKNTIKLTTISSDGKIKYVKSHENMKNYENIEKKVNTIQEEKFNKTIDMSNQSIDMNDVSIGITRVNENKKIKISKNFCESWWCIKSCCCWASLIISIIIGMITCILSIGNIIWVSSLFSEGINSKKLYNGGGRLLLLVTLGGLLKGITFGYMLYPTCISRSLIITGGSTSLFASSIILRGKRGAICGFISGSIIFPIIINAITDNIGIFVSFYIIGAVIGFFIGYYPMIPNLKINDRLLLEEQYGPPHPVHGNNRRYSIENDDNLIENTDILIDNTDNLTRYDQNNTENTLPTIAED